VLICSLPDRCHVLFCLLPGELQVAALRGLSRVVKPGGVIRMLEYVRPHGAVRRAIAKLWEAVDCVGLRSGLRSSNGGVHHYGRIATLRVKICRR
jgi:hypothetical protein